MLPQDYKGFVDVYGGGQFDRHVGLLVPPPDGLDGTLISCDRVAGTTENGNDLWYAGKAKHFAGKIQFIAAPDGTPLWVSDVEPGSFHDLRAARLHALPALYKAARDGLHTLHTLADVGYTGAGIGIHVPFRPHPDIPSPLAPDNRTHNRLLRGIRTWANAPRPNNTWTASR
jgi:hypothetical protein